jgi:uncharacterized membrane protein YhiD involved in acid resistance
MKRKLSLDRNSSMISGGMGFLAGGEIDWSRKRVKSPVTASNRWNAA